MWTVINEIFPTRVRGRAVAFSTAVNWGSAFLVSEFFLTLIDDLGSSATFLLFAPFSVIAFVWIYKYGAGDEGTHAGGDRAGLGRRRPRRRPAGRRNALTAPGPPSRPALASVSTPVREDPMPDAVIVDVVRTPGGRRNGSLSGWHPADLAGEVLSTLVARNDLDPALVEDVIMGCVSQVGAQGLNVGRNAVLAAGFPESVPATTIDRQCGSSQQAAAFAAQAVMAGVHDIVIAAGVEVMSLVPMGALVTDGRFSGGTSGLCIGHVSPEAASGGPLALIEDGDTIEIDIPKRSINVTLSDDELAARRGKQDARGSKAYTPEKRDRVVSRALKAYALLATSADQGALRKLPDEA